MGSRKNLCINMGDWIMRLAWFVCFGGWDWIELICGVFACRCPEAGECKVGQLEVLGTAKEQDEHKLKACVNYVHFDMQCSFLYI